MATSTSSSTSYKSHPYSTVRWCSYDIKDCKWVAKGVAVTQGRKCYGRHGQPEYVVKKCKACLQDDKSILECHSICEDCYAWQRSEKQISYNLLQAEKQASYQLKKAAKE